MPEREDFPDRRFQTIASRFRPSHAESCHGYLVRCFSVVITVLIALVSFS
jgi:hypothetical protein